MESTSEPRFENRYTVCKSTFQEWSGLHAVKNLAGSIFRSIWFLGMLLAGINFIYELVYGYGFSLFYLFIAVFCGYRCFFLPRIRLRGSIQSALRNAGKERWERRVLFGNQITITENSTTILIDYSQISSVKSLGRWYAIVLNTNNVIYILKDGFILGAQEDFLPWLGLKYGTPAANEDA